MTFDNRLAAAARLALRATLAPALDAPRPVSSPRRASPPHRRYLPEPSPSPAPTPEAPPEWRANLLGLHPGEPPTCRRDLRQFLAIWVHLALLLALIKVYRVEGRALFLLAGLAWATLPVHYLLHHRWKRPFFLGVSVAGLLAVCGPSAGLSILGLALGVIGLARLPIAWGVRAGMVAAAGLGLGLVRASMAGGGSAWGEVVWPVLGSMLMFRMIVYLYETKHAKAPEPIVDALGYFFLLPNYCFIHFPVVDYRTLNRSFCQAEVHASQRIGLRMIFNGVVHLLLYRLVDHGLPTTPGQVTDLGSLLLFVGANYLLYLKVSGQFHIACGIMHLFGYALPTTHNHYLLASSFTDYWRRVNIYWKDFMVRLVFHPLAFRWKRRAQWQGLGGATLAVFAATWFLHAYQAFWLRGAWNFSVPDTLFWGILGALVLVNVQLDARAEASDKARAGARGWAARLLHGGKVAATGTTLALLWSLWSCPDLATWAGMFRRAFGA